LLDDHVRIVIRGFEFAFKPVVALGHVMNATCWRAGRKDACGTTDTAARHLSFGTP
jgi:hypothetical protein